MPPPSVTVRIGIIPDPKFPGRPCTPARTFKAALSANELDNFLREFALGNEEEGNCHHAALALLTDLRLTGRSKGWRFVGGYIRGEAEPIAHSWLECDGWALDVAYGAALFARADHYRETKGAEVVASYTAGQFAQAGDTATWPPDDPAP